MSHTPEFKQATTEQLEFLQWVVKYKSMTLPYIEKNRIEWTLKRNGSYSLTGENRKTFNKLRKLHLDEYVKHRLTRDFKNHIHNYQ